MNSNSVACPLDCFDACEAVFHDDICKGSKEHKVTNGKLCVNFANLLKEDFNIDSYIENQKVSLDKALEQVVEKLKKTDPSNTLFYRGDGNLGVMQNAPKTFFSKYGSVMTKGSLCDEIGAQGLSQGRGGNVLNPPIENLIESDVIIVWGRNFTVTSPHMYNLVKDKTFITIDPICTPISKKSELHMQINPKTDHELALLLTRFTYMEDAEDEEFIEEFGEGADWFFDLAKARPVVSYEATTGISLNDVTKFFEIIKDKKVSLLLGLGIQKYNEGVQITRAVDSFAAYIGLHNKDVGGVWYLDESSYGYEQQLKANPKKTVSLPEVDYGSYDLVFIQGANPVVSAPNTKRVIEGLENTFVIFFGTTLNETSKYANIIIPASNFLTKRDVRLSYGHQYKTISNAVKPKVEGTISEYELTQFLNEKFDYESLIEQEKILDYYINTEVKKDYRIDSFEFLEELEVENLYEQKKENEFYFITAKRKENLNSQFKSDDKVYLHPNSGFNEADEVIVSSKVGSAKFIVSLSEDIKENCLFVFSGNRKANYLTSEKKDEEADSAIFQEVLVSIELS